jgi:diaminopimelate decarboxylase
VGEGILTAAPAVDAAAEAALLADARLARRAGALVLDGVPLAEIVSAVGTPTYVYAGGVIRERYAALTAALFDGVPGGRLHFAVKANGTLGVLALLRELGAGADIVSGGELHRALAAGYDPAHVVFSGVGKSRRELEQAIAAGVGQINVESVEEIATLAAVAAGAQRPVRVGLRINPDVTTGTHPYISTGQGGIKFGVPADRLAEAVTAIATAPSLRLSAMAVHIGSQIVDPAPYAAALGKLAESIREVEALGARIDTVDIGGGFGVRYGAEPGLDLAALRSVIGPILRRFAAEGRAVMSEPGRWLVGPAGLLVCETLYVKQAGGKTFVIVDAGMNDLLRPALYNAYHHALPLRTHGRGTRTVSLVGPVCETGDFFAHDRDLEHMEPGEPLVLLGAGAYGFSMSSNYNARPRAAEVLVDRGAWRVIRTRETMDDLLRGEVRPSDS